MGYCEQAESIRYTCSRDPAHYSKDFWIAGKLIFFPKNKMRTRTKKKLRREIWALEIANYPKIGHFWGFSQGVSSKQACHIWLVLGL